MRRIGEAQNKKQVEQVIRGPAVPGAPRVEIDEEEERKKFGTTTEAGGIPGRSERHARRKERAEKRKASMSVTITGDGQVELLEEDERVRRRKAAAHKKQKQITQPRAGKVPIEEPITVRALSEAVGWKVGKLLFQLMELGAPQKHHRQLDHRNRTCRDGRAGSKRRIGHPPGAGRGRAPDGVPRSTGQSGRVAFASAHRHHHGARRSRQDLAARQHSQEQRRRHRGGRHHAGDSRLARRARRSGRSPSSTRPATRRSRRCVPAAPR